MNAIRLSVIAALSLTGAVLVSSDARAWHFNAPHGGGHHQGDQEGRVERRGHERGRVFEDDHHRPQRHCREVEFYDHHGRHRVRVVCD